MTSGLTLRSMSEEHSVDILYEAEIASSSTDPPMEEWSSLILQQSVLNLRLHLIEQGLFDPGSGEVCAKYLIPSDSTVLNHPYYKNRAVPDPGIIEALFGTKRPTDYDSQRLYKVLCDETGVLFIRKFYEGLVKDAIELKYYCVPPACIRSMCLALERNVTVRRLDLTSSFLDIDAWFHLGLLLQNNKNIKEVILSQCSMGADGLRYLLQKDFKLNELDVSKNRLSNGVLVLADKISYGSVVNTLNLSHNMLRVEAALGLADAFKYNVYGITHLDLSWNEFYMLRGLKVLIENIKKSKVLQYLNLSWNGIRNGPLADLLTIKTLERLDLSNNNLSVITVKKIIENIKNAPQLKYLDLSFNPIQPQEAYALLLNMQFRKVRIQTLLLENVPVTVEFEQKLEEILAKSFRKDTVICHGKVMKTNLLGLADMREIVMMRLLYLSRQGPKKKRINILEYLLTVHTTSSLLLPRDMLRDMKKAKSNIDEDLIKQLAMAFPGPRIDRHNRLIDLDKIADYIAREWPNARPKPPIPEPPPTTVSPKKAKSKGAGGKENKNKENKNKGNKKKK